MSDHVNTTSITFATSTSSASGVVPNALGKSYVRVANVSSGIAYIATGAGSATATATGQYLLANTSNTFEKPTDHDTVAMILSAGTGSCVASVGSGTSLQ